MDYLKLFKNTYTDIPKTLEEVFDNCWIVLEFTDGSVISIIIDNSYGDYVRRVTSYNSLDRYFNSTYSDSTERRDAQNKEPYFSDEQITLLHKFIPNIQKIYGGNTY